MLGEHRAQALRDLGVLPCLEPRVERRPDLPAAGVVRLAARRTDCDDRRARLLGERGSLEAGRNGDERAGGGVDAVSAELEHGLPLCDEVELLGRLIRLLVLVDDAVSGSSPRPRSGAEGRDAEVVAHRAVWRPSVVDLVDLVQMCNRVIDHRNPLVVLPDSVPESRRDERERRHMRRAFADTRLTPIVLQRPTRPTHAARWVPTRGRFPAQRHPSLRRPHGSRARGRRVRSVGSERRERADARGRRAASLADRVAAGRTVLRSVSAPAGRRGSRCRQGRTS